MKGDKILIESAHKKAGENVYPLIKPEVKQDLYAITVGGESGCGKSEVATVLSNKFKENGLSTLILQQDDYFVYPPKTNHKMRKQDISRVGLGEVKLKLLEKHINALKQGKSIKKPVMNFDLDKEDTELLQPGNIRILIIEGTYTILLGSVDKKIFIDKSYLNTKKFREKRARDTVDAKFLEEVVRREHEIIKEHKEMADIVLDFEYNIKYIKK